ncbi:Ankyrin repeat protein [Giardia duodenalis]|uniref:Ankyrin repeat protein n=1 Tax=Giardia intestinalis TaxID=5741 RepID=V6TGL2_GIAIN|nr:Ankyrin repeat protein [Giardia intestinalis]
MGRQAKSKRGSRVNKARSPKSLSGTHPGAIDMPSTPVAPSSLSPYSHPLIPLPLLACRLVITGLLLHRGFARYNSTPRSNICLLLGVIHTLFVTLDITMSLMVCMHHGFRISFITSPLATSWGLGAVSARKKSGCWRRTTTCYYILQDLLFITFVLSRDKHLPLGTIFFSCMSILILLLDWFFLRNSPGKDGDQLVSEANIKIINPCNPHDLCDTSAKPLSEPIYSEFDGVVTNELTRQELTSIPLLSSPKDDLIPECTQMIAVSPDTDVPVAAPQLTSDFGSGTMDGMGATSLSCEKNNSSQNVVKDIKDKSANSSVPSTLPISVSTKASSTRPTDSTLGNSELNKSLVSQHSSSTNTQASNITKKSHVITINSKSHVEAHKPITSNAKPTSQTEPDSQPPVSVSCLSLSACKSSSNGTRKRQQRSAVPQSSLVWSSHSRSPDEYAPRRRKHFDKKIIPDNINTTISISSDSIPRSETGGVAGESNQRTLLITAPMSEGTNEGGHTSKAPKLDSIDPDLEIDSSANDLLDFNDLADLHQYGQDNVKCIGAAATCDITPDIDRSNVIKNITSSLFAFTSAPTKDIVKLPHTPSQTTFKQAVLPISEKQSVTLSESDMLILAAKNSDTVAIEMYKGFTGEYDSSGMFALAYCVLANNVVGVKALLVESKMRTIKSMRFNEVDYVDMDALMLSVLSNADKEIIEILVPISDVTIEGYSSMTALMLAAASGNTIAVRLLIDSQRDRKTKDGRTALMIAAEAGQDKCVEMLLEKTSEVCSQNTMGWTALCFAADNGHTACVRLLAPKESMMVIIFAYDRYSASGFVMNFMSGTSLMLAAWYGSAECVSILKDSEAQIKTHKYENTALIFAATAGHADCVKLLIDVEAKMQDSSGRTALMKAVTEDNVSCVELLAPVENGMVDERGTPAIVFAARKNHLDCVSLLAPYEADAFHHLVLNRNWCSPEVEHIIKKNLHRQ